MIGEPFGNWVTDSELLVSTLAFDITLLFFMLNFLLAIVVES